MKDAIKDATWGGGLASLDILSCRLAAVRGGAFAAEPFLQESENLRLFRFQAAHVRHFVPRLLLQGGEQRAIHVSVDHRRMHITLPANRTGVAEFLRHALHGFEDVAFRLGFAAEAFDFLEGFGGEDRAVPGAEILGGELFAGDFAEVGVDVAGIDVGAFAGVIEIGEEFLPGEMLAFLHNLRQHRGVEVDFVIDAGLAAEAEVDGVAFDGDVFVLDGGEAEGVVGAGVFFVADADEGFFEELDHGGEDFFAGEAGVLEVAGGGAADFGECFAEGDEAVEFCFIAGGCCPLGVVAVLFAVAGVFAGGLDVALVGGADPDVGPGGGDGE